MHDTIIIRYGEIALKGDNRGDFERQLVANIKDCLKSNNAQFTEIKRIRGRIFIKSSDECGCLANVFGIISFSPATETDVKIEKIKEEAFKKYTKGTFRVSCQRLDKSIANSLEMNRDIGQFIVDRTKAKVSLKNPDVDIGVELFNKKAYVFNKTIKGAGGLPVGVTGTVALLVEDKNAVKAGLLMMKRGCRLILVKEADIDTKKIEEYAYGFALKEADEIPEEAEAIVTSETLETLKKRDFGRLTLMPLIGE